MTDSRLRERDRLSVQMVKRRMLDLFCGRGGWTNAFLERGWECVGIDINPQPEYRGEFVRADIADIGYRYLTAFDFVCASSPCEEFSLHGMKHFHPDPPYPINGVALFEHARGICTRSEVMYVMENVRSAQRFVGKACNHCGPFYLWGNSVPALMPQGITKGFDHAQKRSASERRKSHPEFIPPELASCVADYAQRIMLDKYCHFSEQ